MHEQDQNQPTTTAVSVVISDDLSVEHLKAVLTEPMNIMISVKEAKGIGMHLAIQAEVADMAMLTGIIEMLNAALHNDKALVHAGTTSKGNSAATINAVLSEHAARDRR